MRRALTASLAALITLITAQAAGTFRLIPAQAAGTFTLIPAHAAGTFMLDESGSLHLASRHGFLLNERGTATGTVRGSIYVHLRIVSTKRVTAEVNIYPRNGSITGLGTADYQRGHTSATFSGTMSIERGTGGYSHAHGGGLSFSGTIQRSNETIRVRVSGRVSD